MLFFLSIVTVKWPWKWKNIWHCISSLFIVTLCFVTSTPYKYFSFTRHYFFEKRNRKWLLCAHIPDANTQGSLREFESTYVSRPLGFTDIFNVPNSLSVYIICSWASQSRSLVVRWASEISLSRHLAFQTKICYSTIETYRFIRIQITVKILQIGDPKFVFQQLDRLSSHYPT